MGLIDGKCDSCGGTTDTLFPVGILDELPSGGMKHVQKWYCVSCKDTLEEEAEDANNEVKPEEKNEDEEEETS